MRTVAVSMVKDEVDVIAGTLRHMADEVDWMIVADNGSTDGTREVLDDLARDLPLTVVDDPDPAYYQAFKMTNLGRLAHAEHSADWVVPFDADELWYAEDRVSVILAQQPDVVNVVTAHLFNHYPTSIDEKYDDPLAAMVWRSLTVGELPKVAVRWLDDTHIHQGNHGASQPHGVVPSHGTMFIRHFPYRSASQFIRKARNGAAAYRLTNLPVDQGNHWRAYGEILERHGEDALADVFREHFFYTSPTDSGLIHDPAPYLRWRT